METSDIISDSINYACTQLHITHEVYNAHVKSQNIVKDENAIDMEYLAQEIAKYKADDITMFVDGVQRNLFVIHVLKRLDVTVLAVWDSTVQE